MLTAGLVALLAGVTILGGVAFSARSSSGESADAAATTGTSASAATATSVSPDPGQSLSSTSTPAPKESSAPAMAGYPSAANTGWQHTGVKLTAYRGPSTVRTAGTVIDGKDIGCVWIQAPNVVIKRSRVRCTGDFPVRVHDKGTLRIEDTEVDGRGNPGSSCVTYEHYTAVRVDCHGVGDGMYITGANVTIQDSYIHDLTTCGDCHNDGIQATAGMSVVIRHNTIENKYTQTGCLKLGSETGPLRNLLVENNLLNGGGYCVYAGGSGSGVSDLRFIGNHFLRSPAGFFRNGGYHGPVAFYDSSVSGNKWSGNVWHDNGAIIKP